MQLWDVIHGIELIAGAHDEHLWRFEASGKYSSRSAYRIFFTGSTAFEPYARLWRSWAPLRSKLFLWTAIMDRCWTADHLARRGLQHPPACPFCDQHGETIEHILIQCVLAREVWLAFKALRRQQRTPLWSGGEMHIAPTQGEEERIQHFGHTHILVDLEAAEQMCFRQRAANCTSHGRIS